MGPGWDPEEDPFRQKQLDKDAKKFKLRKDNQTDRLILDNPDTNVEDFIARYRKGGINREFPGECLKNKEGIPMTIRDVLKSKNTKASKLLIDSRFLK